jgi:hypothetical protein
MCQTNLLPRFFPLERNAWNTCSVKEGDLTLQRSPYRNPAGTTPPPRNTPRNAYCEPAHYRGLWTAPDDTFDVSSGPGHTTRVYRLLGPWNSTAFKLYIDVAPEKRIELPRRFLSLPCPAGQPPA